MYNSEITLQNMLKLIQMLKDLLMDFGLYLSFCFCETSELNFLSRSNLCLSKDFESPFLNRGTRVFIV